MTQVRKLGETQKVAIRNIRRDANRKAETEEKDKQMPEDEADKCKENIQKITNQYEDKVDALVNSKSQEVQEG